MLVLTRKIGEQIHIGEGVVVTLLAVRRGQVRLGITAPPSVAIRRSELAPLGKPEHGIPRERQLPCARPPAKADIPASR
jgi:carbon storage regulator